MLKNKKVSIIIPVYNGSNYLKDAIDSALNQTYENIEIIVVNDGSNDSGKTREVALSYGDKIRYFEKENGGVSTALNYGIEKMEGEYFSWLSHDDMYYPEKVEKQILELKKYDENTILYSDFSLVDKKGNKISDIHLDNAMLTKKPDYAVLRGAIGGITLLIPKKAFDDCGYFDVSMRCVQDYDMWFRLLDKYTFVHMTDILSMTRIHSLQDSNTSPRVLSEGNLLWKKLTFEYPKAKMISYEGSEYLFYREMAEYLDISTPYKEAAIEVLDYAYKLRDKQKNKVDKKSVSVVIVDNGNVEDINKTLDNLKNQTFKTIKYFIEGRNKVKDVSTLEKRELILKNINTDFYVFVSAGSTFEDRWLYNQILELICTDKALVVSDYCRNNKDSMTDNFRILSTVSIYGILFNNKYKTDYSSDLMYIYNLIKLGGSFVTEEKYFLSEACYDSFSNSLDYLKILIEEGDYSDYDIASLCYDIACSYNDNRKSGKKIYMYHDCAKYENLSNSRSFKLFEKYIDLKNKIRKR